MKKRRQKRSTGTNDDFSWGDKLTCGRSTETFGGKKVEFEFVEAEGSWISPSQSWTSPSQ